ncbi:hypothetical protein CEXT_662091, partial [Caerostris extrusa]
MRQAIKLPNKFGFSEAQIGNIGLHQIAQGVLNFSIGYFVPNMCGSSHECSHAGSESNTCLR